MSRHAAGRGACACAVLLLLAVSPAPAGPQHPAGVIYLKAGHVLKGSVVQPSETIIDPGSGQPVTIRQGLFILDDICRRFFFSHAYVDRASPQPFDYGKVVEWKRA